MYNSYKIYPKTNDNEICNNHNHIHEQPHDKLDFTKQVCVKPWGHEFIVYQNKHEECKENILTEEICKKYGNNTDFDGFNEGDMDLFQKYYKKKYRIAIL